MLVNERSLVIVDRKDLDLIRSEEQFQLSGEVSDETAQRIGHKLGAQTIISGSFASLDSQYRLRLRAIAVETAQIQEVFTARIKPDKIIRSLEKERQTVKAADEKFLYLGGRAGLSLGFYGNGGGLADKILYTSQSISGIPAFDGALFFSVSIIRFLEVQTEAIITNDSFDLNSGNTNLFSVSYTSLMIPLLVKLVYRPSIFMMQGFAGAYLSVPLNQMEVTHRNGAYSADISLLGGFMTGGALGLKLGPGTLLLDIRYAGDFSYMKNGNKDISKRNKVFFTVGYEFGLIPK